METSLRNRIATYFDTMKKEGKLTTHLASQSSGNEAKTHEQWKIVITDYVTNDMQGKVQTWFTELVDGAKLTDVFGDRDIGKLFGFGKPPAPKREDFAQYQQGQEQAYQTALQQYLTDLDDYNERMDRTGAYSIRVLFNGHEDLAVDKLALSAFRNDSVGTRVNQINTLLGESLDRKNYEQAWYWYENIYVPYVKSAMDMNRELEETYGLVVLTIKSYLMVAMRTMMRSAAP